jgi:hypothetical protein
MIHNTMHLWMFRIHALVITYYARHSRKPCHLALRIKQGDFGRK